VIVTPESLRERGLVHKHGLIKVLGRGDLGGKAIQVKAHAFSKTAEAAITAAGGSVERLPMPFGNGRPPVQGNQFANR
jgi:large subunit ribosomal protein L15